MRNIKKLIKTWDNESESYGFQNDNNPDYLAAIFHLSNHFSSVKGKRILEVGSGSGQVSANLAAKGGIVNLVDISKKSLEYSKEYFALRKLPVKLFRQNAFDMRFPNESFDFVWNGGVIEHFEDTEKILMIKKMWKLVKPGGKILITAPNAYDLPFMIAKKILELRKKWAFGREDDMTIKRMTDIIKRAGIKKFSIYAYNPIVGFWFFPFGREITNFLGMNTLDLHKSKTPYGHVIVFCARKPS